MIARILHPTLVRKAVAYSILALLAAAPVGLRAQHAANVPAEHAADFPRVTLTAGRSRATLRGAWLVARSW